ncbi:MAG TPA: OmpA family protein [Cyclobacteriaceae bacterium]|nr:OmpA family protein [Cyclobacteriaceae bacterium]
MRIFIVVLAIAVASNGWAQDVERYTSYFVVVGAFARSKEAYAKKFKDDLKKDGLTVDYVAHGNLFLVYIAAYDEFEPSIREMLSTRKQGKFPEAWVKILHEVHGESAEKGSTQSFTEVEEPQEEKSKQQDVKKEEEIRSEPAVVDIPPPAREPAPASAPNAFKILFHLYDANDNNKEVEGNIEIVDTQRAHLIEEHKSTDTVALPDPHSDSGMISFITDVFGYRKVQHEINVKQPVQDSTKEVFNLEGNFYIARFEMVRYHKGDIATLYNVFFYNDAAIMMPESKYELNKLLDMMKSNPRYRILLHGHTNGNARGRIISMGPSKDFFSLKAPDVKEGSGSSKELSGQRAEVIREWLIAQGITADRVEVKAWGGRRMIHDKNSNNARRNVRVEVEVLAE